MKVFRLVKMVAAIGFVFLEIGCAGSNQGSVVHTSRDLAPMRDFAQAQSCSPTIAWNAVRIPSQPVLTYDIAVYKAVKSDTGEYDRGDGVFYREGFPDTFVNVEPALDSGKPYLWSIRVRLLDGKVSQWSTDSKTVKSPPVPAVYNHHWHGFVTPNDC